MASPEVQEAVLQLLMSGKTPSWRAVRAVVGAGSATTLLEEIKEVMKDLAHRNQAEIPDEVSDLMWQLWRAANTGSDDRWTKARAQLDKELAEVTSRLDLQNERLATNQEELLTAGALLEQASQKILELEQRNARLSDRLEEKDKLVDEMRQELAKANQEWFGKELKYYGQLEEVRAEVRAEKNKAVAELTLEHKAQVDKLQEQLQRESERYDSDTARWMLKLDEQTRQSRKDLEAAISEAKALRFEAQEQQDSIAALNAEVARLSAAHQLQLQLVASAAIHEQQLQARVLEEMARTADAEQRLSRAQDAIEQLALKSIRGTEAPPTSQPE